MDQGHLFTYSMGFPSDDSTVGRCPLCRRPRKQKRDGTWYKYCGPNCDSPFRYCATCEKQYQMGVGRAGTRYCSNACRPTNYTRVRAETYICCRCAREYREHNKAAQERSDAVPLCSACRDGYQAQIRDYNLSTEWAMRLMDATHCDACGEPFRLNRSGAKRQLHIDHDHTCCPGAGSCGQCVRGLLCPQCNITAGHLESQRYKAVRAYLDAWRHDRPTVGA